MKVIHKVATRVLIVLTGILANLCHANTYSYDLLNRLTKVVYPDGGSISYAYDKSGNRILLSVVAPNRQPISGNDMVATKVNQAVDVPIPKVLANDRDPDGDTLSISSVGATSTNGGSVALSPGLITYTPAPDFIGEDRFNYTLNDGRGGLTTGTIVVTVRALNAPPLNEADITITANGKRIRFSGIPGQNYMIQFAEAVSGPWTDLSGPLPAGLTGVVEYQDSEQPPPTTRFYRMLSLP